MKEKGKGVSKKSKKDKVINDDDANMCGNIGASTVDDSLAKNLRIVKYHAYELPIRVSLISHHVEYEMKDGDKLRALRIQNTLRPLEKKKKHSRRHGIF